MRGHGPIRFKCGDCGGIVECTSPTFAGHAWVRDACGCGRWVLNQMTRK